MCVRSGSFGGEASVGPECTRRDRARRPLMLEPEVGVALSYVWGQRGVKYKEEDRVGPQPGSTVTA